jgi:Domain of unknown function (DUF397)
MDTVEPRWRKATYSGGNGGNCVEAASTPAAVLVRDTADRTGTVLPVSPAAWRTFVASLKQ